jgi:hypothetical protein
MTFAVSSGAASTCLRALCNDLAGLANVVAVVVQLEPRARDPGTPMVPVKFAVGRLQLADKEVSHQR